MKGFVLMLAIFGFFLFSGCVSTPVAPPVNESISDFDSCVAAGYPVMESFPRQCRTPDGRNFVSEKDRFDFGKNLSCAGDADCILVDSALGFSCCWAGRCDGLDYSLERWIAVNSEWYSNGRMENCPSEDKCGPAPMCPTRAINLNYSAVCVQNSCVKVPVSETLRGKCCGECSAAFSQSPVDVSSEGALCGKFTTGNQISAECETYFEGNSFTVSECE
jgi:hypothetical protein